MPIVKRFPAKKAEPVKKGNIVRRIFTGIEKKFADNVEEYVFNLPKEPITYTTLVFDWIIPYQENHFVLYNQKLKLTPRYFTRTDGLLEITGILCEVYHWSRPKRKIIDGPRGVWHGQIKFFVKSTMEI